MQSCEKVKAQKPEIQFNSQIEMNRAKVKVTCVAACALLLNAAFSPALAKDPLEGVVELGRIQHPHITESSGIAASRAQSNVFWTHTDGGGRKQVLYAITRAGKSLAEYRVTGALIEDWEDIAGDDAGHLFIADIGNNDARRNELAVYQVDEPTLGKRTDGFVTATRSWRLRFPAGPFDCESLFIWKGYGYLISKVFNDAHAELYRFSLTNAAPSQILERVTQLKIDSPVTSAAISNDGNLLGIAAKNGMYVCRIKGEPARAGQAKYYHKKLKHEHIEGCTFVPEGLLATAESREIFLFTDEEFQASKRK
jgi:hypothetical protein